jgi:hypothetical protein
MMFADDTKVSVARSKAEIEHTLARYGAQDIVSGFSNARGMAFVEFELSGWPCRIVLPLPERNAKEFVFSDTGRKRKEPAQYKAWEQACRSRWRVLLLLLRAKLEAIKLGIIAPEQEFLAHIALPDGSTIGFNLAPKLQTALETGVLPKLLLAGSEVRHE